MLECSKITIGIKSSQCLSGHSLKLLLISVKKKTNTLLFLLRHGDKGRRKIKLVFSPHDQGTPLHIGDIMLMHLYFAGSCAEPCSRLRVAELIATCFQMYSP